LKYDLAVIGKKNFALDVLMKDQRDEQGPFQEELLHLISEENSREYECHLGSDKPLSEQFEALSREEQQKTLSRQLYYG
jgi:hypothetical protein